MENTKNLLHEFIKYLEKDKKNNDNAKKALTWATSGDTSKKGVYYFPEDKFLHMEGFDSTYSVDVLHAAGKWIDEIYSTK